MRNDCASTVRPFNPFTVGHEPFEHFAYHRAAGGSAYGTAPYPELPGAHYVFSHDLVSRVLKHPDLLQAPPGEYQEVRRKLVDLGPMALLSRTVLLNDPPQHARLRRPMAPSLSRPVIDALTQRLHTLSRDIVARALATGEIEAVSGLAVPVTFWLLQEILGIEIDDPLSIKSMTSRMCGALDMRLAEPPGNSISSYEECRLFVEEQLARDAFRPEGMAARMVQEVAEGRWSHDDMIANIVLMLFGGQETVVDALGNALVALDRFPDQRALLDRREVSWSDAAFELLRYGASVHYAGARIAAKDIDLGGLRITAGEAVVAVLGSANRDDAVFPDGDRLDLTRPPAPSLTFGTGLHVCLGQHVARLEIAAMIEALFECAPAWRLDAANAVRRPFYAFHGMSKVPLLLA